MELVDVPAFRIDERFPVFSEGWALYAESLADDMGLTADPYARFGRLSGEMWRAVRLVVDTGIHWAHWDRQQAIDYFKAHTARPESDIEQEIDRYSEIPGQALAYKTGEMKIKELRARAAAALGKGFDLREFNNVVLELGTVPLGPLERHVDEWIARRRGVTSPVFNAARLPADLNHTSSGAFADATQACDLGGKADDLNGTGHTIAFTSGGATYHGCYSINNRAGVLPPAAGRFVSTR